MYQRCMNTLLLTVFSFTLLMPNLPAQLPGGFSERSKTHEGAVAAAKFAVNAHDPKL